MYQENKDVVPDYAKIVEITCTKASRKKLLKFQPVRECLDKIKAADAVARAEASVKQEAGESDKYTLDGLLESIGVKYTVWR